MISMGPKWLEISLFALMEVMLVTIICDLQIQNPVVFASKNTASDDYADHSSNSQYQHYTQNIVKPDVSMAQNISQHNLCPANSAYCANEVKNQFILRLPWDRSP
jgi:hypothetical protein